MLGVGKADPVYLDDVFSTYLYKGTGYNNHTITNGVNLAGGGMTWLKARTNASSSNGSHTITDTVRGSNKQLLTTSSAGETTGTTTISSFSSTGFVLGQADATNNHQDTYVSWSFKRQKGFFDVVSYTGNGSNRTIAHSLGGMPGCMLIKCTSETRDWAVYHWDMNSYSPGSFNPNEVYLNLNGTSAVTSSATVWHLNPTTTHFSVGTNDLTNKDGETYVAYLFAGGESTAANARSVLFDGSNDYMTIPTHADLAMGTGDLTMEGWVLTEGSGIVKYIYDGRDGTSANRVGIWIDDTNKLRVYANNVSRDSTTVLGKGIWYHFAWTRQGTTSRLFINGTEELSWSDSVDYAAPASNSYIGGTSSAYNLNGKISNFRIVKGTAVYTSSFNPPTAPLTNITNTKLLCCNNSSVTGSTVSPTTIANSGAVTEKNNHPTPSPFDDPAGFIFGENKDQNIVKTGTYVGNGATAGPEIFLGWEPQWLLIRCIDASSFTHWLLVDTTRGLHIDNNKRLFTNLTNDEDQANNLSVTSTGFKIIGGDDKVNTDGDRYMYLAIRRPDGYVAKPATAGTDVFTTVTGTSATVLPPGFISGFPVDFAFAKKPATAGHDWFTASRLT